MYFNINSSVEYDKNMRPGLLTKIADNATPSLNQYSYSSGLNAVYINSNINNKSELIKHLGFLNKGDVVNFSVEIKHIAGDKPHIELSESPEPNGFGLDLLQKNRTVGTGSFELLKISMTIPKNGYYVVDTGFPTAGVGQALFRNFKGHVLKNSTDGGSSNYDQRLAFINITNGNIIKREVYAKDDYTFSISGTTLTVTWDKPVVSSRPGKMNYALTFVGTYQMTGNVIPICAESTNESFNVRFYNLETNQFLQVSAVAKCEFPVQTIG